MQRLYADRSYCSASALTLPIIDSSLRVASSTTTQTSLLFFHLDTWGEVTSPSSPWTPPLKRSEVGQWRRQSVSCSLAMMTLWTYSHRRGTKVTSRTWETWRRNLPGKLLSRLVIVFVADVITTEIVTRRFPVLRLQLTIFNDAKLKKPRTTWNKKFFRNSRLTGTLIHYPLVRHKILMWLSVSLSTA